MELRQLSDSTAHRDAQTNISFSLALSRLLRLRQIEVDHHELQTKATADRQHASPYQRLSEFTKELALGRVKQLSTLEDPSTLPLLSFNTKTKQWGLVKSFNAKEQWVGEQLDLQTQTWQELILINTQDNQYFTIKPSLESIRQNSYTLQLVKDELKQHKKYFIDASIAGILVNTTAIVGAFYSMQVYDRVVPTNATQTLFVLTLGAIFVVMVEFVAKLIRAGLSEKLIELIDTRLSRTVYQRFLSIRLDQLPNSVGSLASQLRGYETIRQFLTTITAYLAVDLPFILFYLALIAMIGGLVALIPLAFFMIACSVGYYFYRQIDQLASNMNASVNLKLGLLVESIEGSETIKSGQGGWRMLANWMQASDENRHYDLEMRRLSEQSQSMVSLFQQTSFILMIASGALLIGQGALTMGGLLACSILSGRVLAPVAQIPNHLLQWANTKASIRALDRLWQLKCDHDNIKQPLTPNTIRGHYLIQNNTVFNYGNNQAGIALPEIHIKPGEKIAILGPIGSGKTTLLRLLSGMYHPTKGKILLDNMNLAHISKPILAEHIGFLPQDVRLFKGSLRDNLLLGMTDPGDDKILLTAKQTGLLDRVINTHESGLDQMISEGGSGLSGGQKQLVNLTRLILRAPNIWLLDEPTSAVDRTLEVSLIKLFKQLLKPKHTLILITHKIELLSLVERIMVIERNQLMMDGPKQKVLATLNQQPTYDQS